MAVSAAFAVQAYADFGQLWLLYVLAMVQAVLQALGAPARRTFVARLVPTSQLTRAIALNTLSGRVTMLFGPALDGVVAGTWACGPAMPSIRSASLFPALNAAHFGGSPQTLGLLNAAPGVGGLLSAALSGPAGRVSRQGRGMLAGTMIWRLAIACFGLTRSLPLALAALAVAGAADTLTVVFRSSMVQTVTQDEFRGRVSSVEYIIGTEGGPLGNVESGIVAALTTPTISAVSGGIGGFAVAALIGFAFRPSPVTARPPLKSPAGPSLPERPSLPEDRPFRKTVPSGKTVPAGKTVTAGKTVNGGDAQAAAGSAQPSGRRLISWGLRPRRCHGTAGRR